MKTAREIMIEVVATALDDSTPYVVDEMTRALAAAGFKVLGREQTNEMADAISDGPAHSVIGSDGVQHWGTLVSSATAWRTMFDAAEPVKP